MAFTVSPNVAVREIDLTNSVQAASSIEGGFAGKFQWGPVLERVLISNENQLVNTFGQPDTDSTVDFHIAASYLSYTDKLRVVRIGNQTEMDNATDTGTGVAILNDADFEGSTGNLASYTFIAKYAGSLGNSLSVSACTSAAEFSVALAGDFTVTRGSKAVTYVADATEVLGDFFNVGDLLVVDGVRYSVDAVTDASLTLSKAFAGSAAPAAFLREWRYASQFGKAPAVGDLHIIVIDEDGEFTGEAGTILEKYADVTTAAGAKYEDGTARTYSTAINRRSAYIRIGESDVSTVNADDKVAVISLSGGESGNDVFDDDEYLFGYDLFKNGNEVSVPLLIAGASNAIKTNYIIDNIAEVRRDTVVFVSPEFGDVVNNKGSEVTDSIEFRNTLSSTSYAFMDSNWKYVQDKYNDTFVWIPLCGDTAGLAARSERDREAWFSLAGFNRGSYKNVVKFAYNPSEAESDDLFVNDINPATNFVGQGYILMGDKTMIGKPSAFGELGVRRLFIILEVAIANASKFSLFEFNDAFTRAQFVSIVEPFLREVKGRRGLQDFSVVADETVNTPQVVDSNQFVGQIYVKPNRSIRFIELSFVAVRSGVKFSEVVGQF